MTATLLSTWQDQLGAALMRQLLGGAGPAISFSKPPGEPALASHDSLTWRIYKNPVALFAGGVSAVILELAEPRVRSGVWEHTTFKTDPVARMKRTGMAALATAYAARSVAERMITRVNTMHGHVSGEVSGKDGVASYTASDPDLLDWVQVTACFGFVEAYSAYVAPLTKAERDRAYAEAIPAAKLYGVPDPVASQADVEARFATMLPKLERHDIILDFLRIVSRAPILPPPMRSLQNTMIRASVELVPSHIRDHLGLGERWRLRNWEKRLVKLAGAASDRIAIPGSPPVEACHRLGLPTNYLYASTRPTRRTI
ncbi:MAG TPA: oxygenase MpaB family protein [Hyphomonadaceae bacterium]|jgi:uncharacterized protein (DUF2236 family)|nr:oxygenase MpaB family protein [Hyphomonadaceae bacterium]